MSVKHLLHSCRSRVRFLKACVLWRFCSLCAAATTISSTLQDQLKAEKTANRLLPGSPSDLAAACDRAGRTCKAFTTGQGRGGTLKSDAQTTSFAEMSATYVKA